MESTRRRFGDMSKPCRSCGALDRIANGKCRPCQARQRAQYAAKMRAKPKPCRACGVIDRDSTGKCRPCHVEANRRFKERHPTYFQDKSRALRATPIGKERNRRNQRKFWRKHGWAEGEHERAEAALPFVVACECCGTSSPGTRRGWQADHDHATGLFRGFLCNRCNVGAGFIEDEKFVLQINAYLAKHRRVLTLAKESA